MRGGLRPSSGCHLCEAPDPERAPPRVGRGAGDGGEHRAQTSLEETLPTHGVAVLQRGDVGRGGGPVHHHAGMPRSPQSMVPLVHAKRQCGGAVRVYARCPETGREEPEGVHDYAELRGCEGLEPEGAPGGTGTARHVVGQRLGRTDDKRCEAEDLYS